jgi:acyl transferase domain-containing protein
VPGYRNHKFVQQTKQKSINGTNHNFEADRPHLLLFSAHTRTTLENNIADISRVCPGACINDLAYTLGARRSKFDQRTFAVAYKSTFVSDINDASAQITSNITGKAIPAFVFTGMKEYLLELYRLLRN